MGVEIPRDPLEGSDPRFTNDDPDELLQREVEAYGVTGSDPDDGPNGEGPTEQQVLRFVQDNEPRATEFFEQKAMQPILNAYRALRNEHPERSKYTKPSFKNRAAYHRPKTRNAVRRMQTAAATALFQGRDVIDVAPQDESNPIHRAAALLKKEIVNYRLSRSSGRNAIPWFEISIGARTDAYMTGWCCSMQSWSYRRRRTGDVPLTDRYGAEIIRADGTKITKPQFDVLIDRPDIQLIPIEDVGIDPAAPWQDPAQNANFLFIRERVYRRDVEAMIDEAATHSNIPWRDLGDVDWNSGAVDDFDNARQMRTERGDGQTDRYEDTGPKAAIAEDGNVLIWRYLWFFRWDGTDYCVYTIGKRALLSDPIPTADAFPALGGQRPVVIGTDVIAPHDLMPQSNAAALQPMQQEINDQTNLRIDAIRQSVFPMAKIARGKNIDATAVTRRGPNTTILVEKADDLQFETIPNGAAALFNEHDRLNNDFDETAGIFSNSSVQSNRTLNETVGGMKILAGDAAAVANLELRVWTETWVERVIGQIILLCSYYETDERVLSICGQRAGFWKQMAYNGPINDDLLLAEVQCTVDIGTGANDPAEQVGRFKLATDTLTPLVALEQQLRAQPIGFSINLKEVANEVYAQVGFKDGGDRFFTVEDSETTSPELQQAQARIQELEQQVAGYEQGKQAEIELENTKTDGRIREAQAEHELEMQRFAAEQRAGVLGKLVDTSLQSKVAADQMKMDGDAAEAADMRKMMMQRDQQAASAEQAQLDRAAAPVPPEGPAGAPEAGTLTPAPGTPPQGAAPAPGDEGMNVLDRLAAALAQQTQAAVMTLAAEMQRQAEANQSALIAAMQALAQQQQRSNDQQTELLLRAITAPKVVERDDTGRVTGARTVLN